MVYRGPRQEYALFAERLEIALSKRGWNQTQLADKIDITRAMISNYLAAKSKPDSGKIVLLANALNVSAAWLYGADVNPDGSAITQPDLFNDPNRKVLAEIVKNGSDEEVEKIIAIRKLIR